MGAISMLRRAEVRRRWASILGLMLLVGVVGAVAMAGAAGARRSASALERFEENSRKADAEIVVGDVTADQVDAFRHVRGVAAVAELRQLEMFLEKGEVALAGAIDRRFGTVVDRPRVVRGRRADASAPFEVELGEHLAALFGIKVGDRLSFVSHTPSQVAEAMANGDFPEPQGPEVRLRVVGIVRRPLDLGVRGAAGGVLVPTPAFVREYRDQIGSYAGSILRVRTAHGAASLPEIVASARRIFGRSQSFEVVPLAIETEGARSAVGVVTVAIWVFAGVFALAGIVTVGIVLGRQAAVMAGEQATLRALGLTRPERALAVVLPAVPVALGGAAVAVVGAIALSPRFPVGLARQAEPELGVRLDGAVLLGGVFVVIVLVLAFAAMAAARVTRNVGAGVGRGGRAPATTFVARLTARLHLSPVPTTGVRMALEPGRGSTAVPVRSAIVGVAVAVVGLVAVLTFVSSLDRLTTSRASWGWTWDVAAYDDGAGASGGGPCGPVDSAITADRRVEAVASVCGFNVQLDDHVTAALGFTSMRGHVERTSLVEGREPRRADEVAVGVATLDALGKRIGETVRAHGRDGPVTYRIVGTVALPVTGPPQPLADGAVFSGAGLRRLPAGDQVNQFFVANFAPGVDHAVGIRSLRQLPGVYVDGRPTAPVEIDRLRQVDGLPAILGVFLGLLAVVAVGHALVTGVRRRRRDLAILKTLGFRQRQVRGTVAWQATTLAAVGLLVGMPLGIVVGRAAWKLVADDLGVAPVVSLPLLALTAVALGTVAIANLVAVFPARVAASTKPAVVLRSE